MYKPTLTKWGYVLTHTHMHWEHTLYGNVCIRYSICTLFNFGPAIRNTDGDDTDPDSTAYHVAY